MTKTYIFPDGKKAVFEYDHNGVGKITLECMDMLMGQLIAYKRCQPINMYNTHTTFTDALNVDMTI